MTAPIYSNVIERFFSEALDPVLQNFVYNGYATLADHLKYPLGLAIVLFITLLGVSISQGWAKLSVAHFVKVVFKIGILYSFAMHWDTFSEWVVNGISQSAEAIGGWLVHAAPVSIPQLSGGITGALQSVLTEVSRMGQAVWKMGSWHTLEPFVTAICIFIFGYMMILVGLFEIVMAKIMLAVLFATAPLFISFTLFKSTQGFFERWLGMISGFSFLLIFIMTVLALALSFMQWAIGDISIPAHELSLISFVPIMLVSFMGVGLLLKVGHMAQSIGGAVCIASGTEMLASGIGNYMAGGARTLRMASKGLRVGHAHKSVAYAANPRLTLKESGIQMSMANLQRQTQGG